MRRATARALFFLPYADIASAKAGRERWRGANGRDATRAPLSRNACSMTDLTAALRVTPCARANSSSAAATGTETRLVKIVDERGMNSATSSSLRRPARANGGAFSNECILAHQKQGCRSSPRDQVPPEVDEERSY